MFLSGKPSGYKYFPNLLKTNLVSENDLKWLVSDEHQEFFNGGADSKAIYSLCLNFEIML